MAKIVLREKSKNKRFSDLEGKSFYNWTVLSYLGVDEYREHHWLCRCVCGTERGVRGKILMAGKSKSCGQCIIVVARLSHGHCCKGNKHPEYSIWAAMRGRCFKESNKNYHSYGGRGITICDRWRGENGFVNFLEDMGERPSKDHSVDRIDNDGHYSPENCRWATKKEQNTNRRDNKYFTYKGKEYLLSDLAEMFNLKRSTLSMRVYSCGWDITKAVETPVQKRNS